MKTPKLLWAACGAFLLSGTANADLLINEVVDGDLPGGQPKWVELHNTGAGSEDPTAYAIANYNNGNTTPGGGSSTQLVGGLIPASGYFILSYENTPGTAGSIYTSVYSDNPDMYIGPFTNGDDVISLEDLVGTFLDQYGELGVDGTGEIWEYTDGYSYRCGATANGGTFDASEWVFGGVKSLEDEINGTPGKVALLLGLTSPRAQTTSIAGNPNLTANYCTSGTSTNGCTPILSSIGDASATAASGFVVSATGVEGQKDGLFFYGQNGKQANAWGNGTSFQCVIPPVKRGGLLTGMGTANTCDGCFSQDLNARWCPTCPKPNQNPTVGTLQIQFWYRDPFNTSNQTTSLSDALEVTVLP